jgi:hypothetical protein
MASQDEFGLIVLKNLDLKKAIDGTILKNLKMC